MNDINDMMKKKNWLLVNWLDSATYISTQINWASRFHRSEQISY